MSVSLTLWHKVSCETKSNTFLKFMNNKKLSRLIYHLLNNGLECKDMIIDHKPRLECNLSFSLNASPSRC